MIYNSDSSVSVGYSEINGYLRDFEVTMFVFVLLFAKNFLIFSDTQWNQINNFMT